MRALPKDSHTLQHKPGIADLLRVAPRAMAAPGSVSNSTQSHMPRRQQAARHRLIRKKSTNACQETPDKGAQSTNVCPKTVLVLCRAHFHKDPSTCEW
jgi:hypothetical protein